MKCDKIPIAIVVLVSLASLPAHATDRGVVHAVRFALCASNVKTAVVARSSVPGDKTVTIEIKLNPISSSQLEKMTRNHIGQTIEIVYDGAILLRTPILAVNDSGLILSRKWTSSAAARKMTALLTDPTIKVPCGPMK